MLHVSHEYALCQTLLVTCKTGTHSSLCMSDSKLWLAERLLCTIITIGCVCLGLVFVHRYVGLACSLVTLKRTLFIAVFTYCLGLTEIY